MAIYFNNHANPESVTYERFNESGLDREWPDRVIFIDNVHGLLGRVVWEKQDGGISYKDVSSIDISYDDMTNVIQLRKLKFSYIGIEQGTSNLVFVYHGDIIAYPLVRWDRERLLGTSFDKDYTFYWQPNEPVGNASISGDMPNGLSFYRAFCDYFNDYAIRSSLDGESTIKSLSTDYELTPNTGIIVKTKITSEEVGKMVFTNTGGAAFASMNVTLWLKSG